MKQNSFIGVIVLASLSLSLTGYLLINKKRPQYSREYQMGEYSFKIRPSAVFLYKHKELLDECAFGEPIYLAHPTSLTNRAERQLLVVAGNKMHDKEKRLYLLEIENDALHIRAQKDVSILNPWKILTCDVDGDGIAEIALGVFKESPLHPVLAKRPFLYYYKEGKILPKWRGSRLSHPFEDFEFLDITGDGAEEILALEYLQDGSMILNAYYWKGFGFESDGFYPIPLKKSLTITKEISKKNKLVKIDSTYYSIDELRTRLTKGDQQHE